MHDQRVAYFVASPEKRRVPVSMLNAAGRPIPVDTTIEPGAPAHAVPAHSMTSMCGVDTSGMWHFPDRTFADVGHDQLCLDCLVALLAQAHQLRQRGLTGRRRRAVSP